MRQIIILLAAILLASPALADSPWYLIGGTSGTVGTVDQDSARPGRSYQTTIDSSGQSETIVTLGCPDVHIRGDSVSSTYTPNVCESGAANRCSPCHSSGAIAVDNGCDESAAAAMQITSATSGDVIVLVCGE